MTDIRRTSTAFASVLVLIAAGSGAWARSPTPGAPTLITKAPRDAVRAFIKMDSPVGELSAGGLYVGQAVPVTIHAHFLGGTGVTVNGQPRITSDALTLSEVSEKPRQSSTQVGGLPYTTLTWTGILTAVKAGATSTALELPVGLSYREAPRMGTRFGRLGQPGEGSDDDGREDKQEDQGGGDGPDATDPIASLLRQSPFASDPFFARMFKGGDPFRGMFDDLAGTIRQREVTLRDQGRVLRVLELPPGQPPGFTGAVGTFEISAALGDENLHIGEPATLKLTVRGRGSFARLSESGLSPSDSLGTYGVTSTFTPGRTPTAGEKVFTQTIAPRRAGELNIPGLTLAYFDPGERRYITRRTTPIRVTVDATTGETNSSPLSSTPPAPSVVTADSPAEIAQHPGPAKTIVPDIVRSTLTPSFRMRWFWGLAAALCAAAAVLVILGRTYRSGALGRLKANWRVRREISFHRRSIEAAVSRGDAVTLFEAGRKAFQAHLGAAWGVAPEALAAADIESRLGPRGARIRQVFERADRLTYAGGISATKEDLSYWRGLVSDELRLLEATT